MAADTISGYVQGLLDGIEFKQTAYALDRDSRKAALARFLKRASSSDPEEAEEERRLAAYLGHACLHKSWVADRTAFEAVRNADSADGLSWARRRHQHMSPLT